MADHDTVTVKRADLERLERAIADLSDLLHGLSGVSPVADDYPRPPAGGVQPHSIRPPRLT